MWKNIKTNLSKGYQSVSAKAGELTKMGRLKLEVLAVKRDIERGFIELGGRVYQSFTSKTKVDISKDKDIKKLVSVIKENEKKLIALEKKLEQIKDHRVVSNEE